jgi:hypothetical protein
VQRSLLIALEINLEDFSCVAPAWYRFQATAKTSRLTAEPRLLALARQRGAHQGAVVGQIDLPEREGKQLLPSPQRSRRRNISQHFVVRQTLQLDGPSLRCWGFPRLSD